VIAILVVVLILCGLVFFTGGTVGILRLPDLYCRLHAASNLDTGGSLLLLAGLALFNLHHFSLEALLTSCKILLILVFVFLSGPIATHGIVDAGVRAGLAPWVKGEKRE